MQTYDCLDCGNSDAAFPCQDCGSKRVRKGVEAGMGDWESPAVRVQRDAEPGTWFNGWTGKWEPIRGTPGKSKPRNPRALRGFNSVHGAGRVTSDELRWR